MADGSQVRVQELGRLMEAMRPRLHRYCARMIGSAVDGEDVVQDALAKAAAADLGEIEHPERWLFRIAHNTALDALRRRRRRDGHDAELDLEGLGDPRAAADVRVAAAETLRVFLGLSPVQRSVVILVDVLGHSIAETVEILQITVASGKAALQRGRQQLRGWMDAPRETPALPPAEVIRLRAYADRFNARDFDSLRALLAEDVRLDLAARLRLEGATSVAVYFTRYDENPNWRATLCLAEGRPALLISDSELGDYVVLLAWRGERIAAIRDFRYARYAMEEMAVIADVP
ncbi:MAG TPA: sigma-70 family RNA polymerase sigma factor [Caulobacteraceae bacterium]|nr:sigma-70 family RNA polymerase sigma factor [Caulobacteraceae bacterium]